MTSKKCAQDCAHVPDWNPKNQATARLRACSLASASEPKGLTDLRAKLSDLPRDMQKNLLESELRLRKLEAEKAALEKANRSN